MRLEERKTKRKTKRKPQPRKRIKNTRKKQPRKRVKKTQKGGLSSLVSSTEGGAMPNITGINPGNQYSISPYGVPSGLPNPPAISGGVNNGNNRPYIMRGGDVRNSLIPGPLLIPMRNLSHGFSNIYNSFFGNLPGANPNPWNQPIYNNA
uniref:Uncharacterized protein n=1 Tax=viral metagenome TaxID=1070528 RepID=A0A6C0HNX5_9ZZZZ